MLIRVLRSIDRLIGTLCVWGLTIALFMMIGFTLLNVLLRWQNTTLLWIEPLVRQLVFISGFLGGAVATAAKQHIAIDVFGRVLETFHLHRFKNLIDRVIYIFCITALVWISYAGYLLVELERDYGQVKFLGLHSSTLALVIPIGMLIIAFRFFYLFVASFGANEDTNHDLASIQPMQKEGV